MSLFWRVKRRTRKQEGEETGNDVDKQAALDVKFIFISIVL